eukprot:CAMPEP_0119106548 /NCGR_PEP_ID=MMETSP1180-20130426/4640_1 /TAXON_ID=3052 ORGANISM="Chlamydomonas cf sp, Strain CCMP681" /NCGR_SAMPLE_ID=MMETSP1180 /ASSEMBLY_ACC=CAM_ASM_000741 /LENGTH=218 /DNA_ID=CAMNT_0007091911 /DNA_START=90 /DNA_END=746 /DNA_ORIENTATION=+
MTLSGRSRSTCAVTRMRPTACRAMTQEAEVADGSKTVVVKNKTGDLPFPWSEKDPYRLPVSIERVQRMLMSKGWEKPWVEQIIDRIMKNMLRTTEERAMAVIQYLMSIGLKSDEVCNMASISVVLLGLNPETRMRPVVAYLERRGVPASAVPDLVLKHPRLFEYKAEMEEAVYLSKGRARIQVDVITLPDGEKVVAVNYYRDVASFLESPVAPAPPLP